MQKSLYEVEADSIEEALGLAISGETVSETMLENNIEIQNRFVCNDTIKEITDHG